MPILRRFETPVGLVFMEEDGTYTLRANNGLALPDSITKNVNIMGVSDDEFDEAWRQEEIRLNDYYKTFAKKTVKKNYPGHVYAVRVGNKLKVGRTKNPTIRFKQYQKICDNFEIFCTKEVWDYGETEKYLCELLGGSVCQNEWFEPSEENIKIIVEAIKVAKDA